MRPMKYLSPTSLDIFYSDREKFYIQYLCETRTPREPQTAPMAVGSAFDAYVKSYLVERLIGKRPEFELDTILTSQVEPHNRDEARRAGKTVFDAYQKQGALSDILLDLEGCIGLPRFETSIEGPIGAVSLAIGAVPFLGKPDIFFIHKKGARIIFDWKVNGYYSINGMAPKAGYVRMRSPIEKENGISHPKAMVMDHQGIKISITHPMDVVDPKWAAQLSIYAWLLGEDIGGKFVVAIDQIACNPKREFRIAQHRSVVSEAFQQKVFTKAHEAWYAIQNGHIFTDMTKEESDARCKTLDIMMQSPPDRDFMDLLR